MEKIGLYLHIPFCSEKCPYCDFYSFRADSGAIDRYTEFLEHKLRRNDRRRVADTIYFGGGTPSLLGTDRLCRLLDAAFDGFGAAEEITMEVNPKSAMSLDFAELKKHGLNRVSVGLQSANDGELELLGRRHKSADAAAAVKKIRQEGISNISLDLMIGISGQTADSLKKSVSFCSSLGAAHVSAYLLKIEEGTEYFRRQSSLDLPDEDEVCSLYELTVRELAQCGYEQYEISNFARPGMESRHNLKYWRCEEYLGIGPAAHSFLDGRRFFTPRSIEAFYSGEVIDDGEGGSSEEYSALALRLREGLRFDDYKRRFGSEFPPEYVKNSRPLAAAGYVNITDSEISLTVRGFLCSNAVTAQILYG